jgi:hypothetical protein
VKFLNYFLPNIQMSVLNNLSNLPKVFRINQFEAENFDEYMINIIVDSVKSSFENSELSSIKKYHEEIKMILKLVYYSFKLLKGKATEGQRIYNVQFDVVNDKIKKFKIIGYLLCKIVVPYIMYKIEDYITRSQYEDENGGFLKKLKTKILIPLFRLIDIGLQFFDTVNFILFIKTNKFPTIWHRLFNLPYTLFDPNRQSQLSFNYLMKRVVWGYLAKIILFFFNFTIGRKGLQSIYSQLMTLSEETQPDNLSNGNKCPICKSFITMCSVAENCGHNFCYYCINLHMKKSELCPVCYTQIKKVNFKFEENKK